jgi:hypothetical protein
MKQAGIVEGAMQPRQALSASWQLSGRAGVEWRCMACPAAIGAGAAAWPGCAIVGTLSSAISSRRSKRVTDT